MPRKGRLSVVILLISLFVGILFAYLTRGSTVDSQLFITMATVQGAFVGIVFSIFVLASQVSAAQFTPLTLEQLSRSRGFAALLGFYIFSILMNIYLSHTQTISVIPNDYLLSWNIALGVGAALTTAALLSLLIARQLLAELTTPEHLLKRTAKSVSREAFVKSTSKTQSQPTAPKRTALFTIERILISAHKSEDEYTVQQAIHQLWEAIDQLLTPSILFQINYNTNESSYTDDLELNRILGYWSTAVTYGSKGPLERIERTARAHTHILITLLKANEITKVVEQLKYLHDLSAAGFDRSESDSVLSEYTTLAPHIAAHRSSEPLAVVLRHHSEFIDTQIRQLDEVNEQEEVKYIDTLLVEIIRNHIVFLEQVWLQELAKSTTRSRTDSILTQLYFNIDRILESYEKSNNTVPRKQTLLTELHKRLIQASSNVDVEATQPTDRYLNLVAEISITLDREADEVAEILDSELAEDDIRRDVIVNRLQDWSLRDSYQIELETLSVQESSISKFIERLAGEITSQ